MDNPYLDKFRKLRGDRFEPGHMTYIFEQRIVLCKRYAWAVPTRQAIHEIV